MNRLLSTCSGLLLLTAVACSKQAPEPKLEGTWTVQYTELTIYNADGSVKMHSPSVAPPAPTTYTFGPTQFTVREGNRSNSYDYTREQTILRCQHTSGTTTPDQLIQTLTKRELVLKQTSIYTPDTGPAVSIVHLTR